MLRLTDGTPVGIRPLLASDRSWLATAVQELSAESRFHRFLAPIHALSEQMLVKLVDEVDGERHVALVAIINPGGPDEARAGVGRYIRWAGDPQVAEIAITVTDLRQGRGLGGLLGAALAEHAAAHGIRAFTATISADNEASLRLVSGLGSVVERRLDGPGVLELRVELAPKVTDS